MNNTTPPCPNGLYEYECNLGAVDLVCHLDYLPAERGSTDSMGAAYEPSTDAAMVLVSVYAKGSAADVIEILSSNFVQTVERLALNNMFGNQ